LTTHKNPKQIYSTKTEFLSTESNLFPTPFK